MAEPRGLERAKQYLQPNEQVVEWSDGLCESTILGKDAKRRGYVLATDRRVFVFVPKMFGNFELEEYPFGMMSSIEYGKGVWGHSVTLIASGNAIKVTMMNEGDPVALVEYVRSRLGKREAAKVPCPACGFENESSWQFCGSCGAGRVSQGAAKQDDFVERLERVAALHEKGMLTEEEFQTAKAKLLG